MFSCVVRNTTRTNRTTANQINRRSAWIGQVGFDLPTNFNYYVAKPEVSGLDVNTQGSDKVPRGNQPRAYIMLAGPAVNLNMPIALTVVADCMWNEHVRDSRDTNTATLPYGSNAELCWSLLPNPYCEPAGRCHTSVRSRTWKVLGEINFVIKFALEEVKYRVDAVKFNPFERLGSLVYLSRTLPVHCISGER